VTNAEPVEEGLGKRIWSRKAALLLGRNTVVSTFVFLIGLALLWLLVEFAHVDKLLAAGATFLVANSLHYALGRAWIYRGTQRGMASGYGLFLINAMIGLGITIALFDLFIRYTAIHYLVSRVLVSVVAGLVMFLSNAILNFRRL
jgi:putative flippase GtrA